MDITSDLIKQAYKKLKSSIYYDNNHCILRKDIALFEDAHKNDLDSYFEKILDFAQNPSPYNQISELIFNNIDVMSFPKKINTNDDVKNEDRIVNYSPDKIKIEELQYFIKMPIEGHILGVLWVMLLGYNIDKNFYNHSYGNRISKNLINEFSKKPTFSPYLFEPYYIQYESWRDTGLNEAEKHMKMDQDVVIITLDFKRYYYSLDIDEDVMKKIYEEAKIDIESKPWFEGLNQLIFKIIKKYSSLFGESFKRRNILPIGFLPSNIIGNWCLNNFDKAIINGWNPIYYGRYVDDILIVDKIEKNSDIFQKANEGNLKKEHVINFFMTSCSKWTGLIETDCKKRDKFSVLIEKKDDQDEKHEEEMCYQVNPFYNPIPENNSEIIVQDQKVRLFYFKSEESESLIRCFKYEIAKNKSGFKHLPEDDSVFVRDDYTEIYKLSNRESVNKFRGISDFTIDKFNISKFLGKYLRIGGMIRDKKESKFEKDILRIFNTVVTIENYASWEKIIEIFVINENYSGLRSFCERISKSIEDIELSHKISDNEIDLYKVKKTLYDQVYSSLCRSFAIVWKKKRIDEQINIFKTVFKKENILEYSDKAIDAFYRSRMIDKSVMPILSDMIDKNIPDVSWNINLTKFEEVLPHTKKIQKFEYIYFPYLLQMYDLNMVSFIEQLSAISEDNGKLLSDKYKETVKVETEIISNNENGKYPFEKLANIHNKRVDQYYNANYRRTDSNKLENKNQVSVKHINNPESQELDKNHFRETKKRIFEIKVGSGEKNKLQIALANVRLDEKNIEKIVKGIPNRSYSRYKDLSEIVNNAIDKKADILVLPEAYVPYEWIKPLARVCAKNKLAIIAGVEHIKFGNKVLNFTATILPYLQDLNNSDDPNDRHESAYISFHLKNHYSPHEIELIEGYRLKPVNGENYELYKWNDCYFAVYCCYELASISDRALFQSYADMIIAVEWNKDTHYYSNILESLSRDIHCYCVQVNSANYGDSRITQPSKTELKDIIKIKGGNNNTILISEINISDLRNYQIKEYSLQKENANFKPTPPQFNKDIVLRKINKLSLWKA